MTGSARLERRYRRVLACYPKAFRRESEDEVLAVLMATAHEGQRSAFGAFFGLLTTVVFFGIGQGTGADAWPVTWPDVIATTVLWLVGLATALLIVSETASPYHQRRAATRTATPANGTGAR